MRPKVLKEATVVSARVELDMYEILQEISRLESNNTGKIVSIQELIRNALDYVYRDNERLRECFRRSRAHIVKRKKWY